MSITRSQQAKQTQLVKPKKDGTRPGYYGADAGFGDDDYKDASASFDAGDGRGGSDRDFSNARKAIQEREKIKEEIAKGPTLMKRFRRNPFVQAGRFFSNPVGFGINKILDARRAKKVNELFGVDDDLGYTGADAGFVVSQPEKPTLPQGGGDGQDNTGIMQYVFTPFQQDIIEDSMDTGPIAEAIRLRDKMGGPRLFAAEGGIMDLEQAREGYKFGKLVGKIGRAIKKIGKSKVGKAALTAAATFKLGGGKFSNLFKRGTPTGFSFENIGQNLSSFLPSDNKDRLALAASGALVAAPFIFGEDDSQSEYEKFLAQRRGQEFDIPGMRAKPYDTLGRAFVAEGGKPEPVATKTMPLLDMGGKEMDLRAEGGFVPIGRMEKADDVPARLSKNEFVFTADAVRNAGDGNVDKGAEVMYNMMKNLEAGGEVSEESQGLDGARKMFQTSQRLEEVL